ncbi:unnamed protein product [Discosporangium mesarthrocarpum]
MGNMRRPRKTFKNGVYLALRNVKDSGSARTTSLSISHQQSINLTKRAGIGISTAQGSKWAQRSTYKSDAGLLPNWVLLQEVYCSRKCRPYQDSI